MIPTADRTKATVMVKVTILEKDKDLKPEMSAKVTFLEPDAKTDAPRRGARAKPQILVPRRRRDHSRRRAEGLRESSTARRKAPP